MRLNTSDHSPAFMCLLLISITLHTSSSNHYVEAGRIRSQRLKIRGVRHAPVVKDSDLIGYQNCSEEDRLNIGCLNGGVCQTLVTSRIHKFVICKCPPDRQGDRCEEIAINVDQMAEDLKKINITKLCEDERYDILSRKGYESSLLECQESKKSLTNKEQTSLKKVSDSRKRIQKIRKKKKREKLKKRRRERRRKQKLKERRLRSKSRLSNLLNDRNRRSIRHQKTTSRTDKNNNLLTTLLTLTISPR